MGIEDSAHHKGKGGPDVKKAHDNDSLFIASTRVGSAADRVGHGLVQASGIIYILRA